MNVVEPPRSQSAVLGAEQCPFHVDRYLHTDRSNEQRTMVLTGASRGIGHATVKLFSDAGWRIITCSRHPFERERCPWDAGPDDHVEVDLGDRAADHPGDRRNQAAPRRRRPACIGEQCRHLSQRRGRIAARRALNTRRNVDDVFHVNFLAPILLARGLFDELKAGHGSVVNVTSIVGSRVHPFAGTAYATSKAALACLTREMAHDLAPHGIRVNAAGSIARGSVSRNARGARLAGHSAR